MHESGRDAGSGVLDGRCGGAGRGGAAAARRRLCHLREDRRAAASAEFLVEEDYEEPFTTTDDAVLDRALFTITFERDGDRVHLTFEDSGGQDWAFVAMLPQLSGDDPTLRPSS